MHQERRGNPRVPVVLDAVLNYQALALVGTIRNISLNGAFLEAPAEDLPFTDTPVELSLTLGQNGEPRYHRILARVRRVAGNGAGLSFSDLEKDAYFDLVNLVYHA